MSEVKRTKPELWERIKNKWLNGNKAGIAGKWNARKAQLATIEYKQKGGGYIGPKKNNSLTKWTNEEWGYIKGSSGRYLPKSVRDKLTERQKAKENRIKGNKKGRNIPYTRETKKLMKQEDIF